MSVRQTNIGMSVPSCRIPSTYIGTNPLISQLLPQPHTEEETLDVDTPYQNLIYECDSTKCGGNENEDFRCRANIQLYDEKANHHDQRLVQYIERQYRLVCVAEKPVVEV